jgi:hypothetical protein
MMKAAGVTAAAAGMGVVAVLTELV